MRISTMTFGALLLATTAPAFAQDVPAAPPEATPTAVPETPSQATPPADSSPGVPAPVEAPTPAFKLTAGATLISEYRFRGVTQSNEDGAVQGTVGVAHESGLYVGVWASSIDGRTGHTPALFGYGTEEVDFYGGFTKSISGFGVDVGVLYYYYPGGFHGKDTDFFEPYASVSYTLGPVAAKVGASYAWKGQDGLRGLDTSKSVFTANDNLYAYGELSVGIPTTPFTVKGHVGYSDGPLGALNFRASDNDYYDWSGTLEAAVGILKVGVSYVDTDINNVRFAGQRKSQGFAQVLGRGSTVLGYVGVSF